jgi:hypothetical protein
MGFAAFLNLRAADIAAFFIASLLGFFAGSLVPAGPWALFAPILVAYHLFLIWLVIAAEHRTGFSLPVVSTALTHLACLAVILPLGLVGQRMAFFSIFRYGIASLAIFESGWLFSGKSKVEAPAPFVPVATSTADDYQEWTRYLAQQNPSFNQPGASMKAEYEKWLQARAQSRLAASSPAPQRVENSPEAN